MVARTLVKLTARGVSDNALPLEFLPIQYPTPTADSSTTVTVAIKISELTSIDIGIGPSLPL